MFHQQIPLSQILIVETVVTTKFNQNKSQFYNLLKNNGEKWLFNLHQWKYIKLEIQIYGCYFINEICGSTASLIDLTVLVYHISYFNKFNKLKFDSFPSYFKIKHLFSNSYLNLQNYNFLTTKWVLIFF